MVECTRCCPPKKILKRSFKSHFRRRHEEKTLKCSECSKTFRTKYKMNHHLKIVHEGQRPHKCDICGKSSGTIGNLQKHMNSVHKVERPFKCPECSQTFTQRYHMNVHVSSVHEKTYPFICSKCVKRYTSKTLLMDHIAIVHEGKQPYNCKRCHTSFSRHQTLIGHQKRCQPLDSSEIHQKSPECEKKRFVVKLHKIDIEIVKDWRYYSQLQIQCTKCMHI